MCSSKNLSLKPNSERGKIGAKRLNVSLADIQVQIRRARSKLKNVRATDRHKSQSTPSRASRDKFVD
jgi:hypothetical protein